MELGTFQSWLPEYEDIYPELGITWVGVGFSARPQDKDVEEQLKWVDLSKRKGMNVFIKWVCDPVRVRQGDEFFKQCEYDFKWMAENIDVKLFEIFPEPSCPLTTGRELMIQDYFEVLRIAHETMKSVDDKIEVWNGGIGFFRTMWFLADFFEMGLPLTDKLNLHPYMFGNTCGQVATRISNLLVEAMWSMEITNQVKPVIVTEWGAPTEWRDQTQYESYVEKGGVPALTEQEQAELFIEVLEQFKAIDCPLFCFAALRDPEDNTTHWSGHGGFFNPLGGKKLAYEAVANWVAGQKMSPENVKQIQAAWSNVKV